ncbi:pyridoxamine 5'-phosphate oxidase family protein [Fulvivirga kasyanovii]|uniref:Pyridoxamine 5'-phosphate oxidase family protein n=1 Tax=Fulvivirga kasyanovii TaxID=396812 RepID=A0ABW9RLP2_9BACT|nr:pyridoxamine 5'-phosphate oxidase family protein [Fulvivirga kasyanovii]MTI24901.1 pyridoxamine 5'-phosphate oxidase family protein [Fulvivirga kasyanovii]
MLGNLTDKQVDYVLYSQVIGRIGCYADGEIFVVPVTYAFDGQYIYAHSKEGKKIEMMRANSQVCFEVEDMDNLANWRCAIIWGTYEELKDQQSQKEALQVLNDRIMPLLTSETARAHRQTMIPQVVEKEKKPIIYRIKVEKKTGRFEKGGD